MENTASELVTSESAPRSYEIFRQVPEALLHENDESPIDLGLPPELRRAIAAHLYKALADSEVLQLKALRYYWNVKGPFSHGIRSLLFEQARDQAELSHGLSARIRAHSFEVPYSLVEFLELSEIRERGTISSAEEMLRDLANAHALLARGLKRGVEVVESAGDYPTREELTRHIAFHESAMRNLLSCLQEGGLDSDVTGLLPS